MHAFQGVFRAALASFAKLAMLAGLSLSVLGTGCVSGAADEPPGGDPEQETEFNVETQPEHPTAGDDPFFFEPSFPGAAFKILITRDTYQIRQIAHDRLFKRKRDVEGDRGQVEFFQEEHDRVDFMTMNLEGVIQIRLNPLSGSIEHISYIPGRTPRTWQASKYFQDDVSRFRFDFLQNAISPREFKVQYQWRITQRPGLSEEEQRRRAIEYLNTQTR
jgi:hypothetical protein